MLAKGIPQNVDEAREVVAAIAATDNNQPSPPHYPHSQIVSLGQVAEHLLQRVEALEAALTAPRDSKADGRT
jgi:hypothetical protein